MKFKGNEKNTKYEGSRFEIINKIFSIEGLEISHSGVSLFYKHNEGDHDAW